MALVQRTAFSQIYVCDYKPSPLDSIQCGGMTVEVYKGTEVPPLRMDVAGAFVLWIRGRHEPGSD